MSSPPRLFRRYLISFLISSLSFAALFTSGCLKDSVNNNDRESIIILLHRASCSRLTSQQVGLRRFNIPTRIARCISHGLGFIIPTSQKCSEPFQIFGQVIIASKIEPVRHVTPPAVGERGGNIVTLCHMSGPGVRLRRHCEVTRLLPGGEIASISVLLPQSYT